MPAWLRLVISAGAATALLAVVIAVGARFLQWLPAPEPPAPEASQPADAGAPDEDGLALSLSPAGAPVQITERDVADLREFLAESPGARLARALADSDPRFLGLNGAVVLVPGIEDPERAVHEGRVRLIPGTSDQPISDEHEALVERSRRYATAYNALLSQRASRGTSDSEAD